MPLAADAQSLQADLDILAQQEALLRFTTFDPGAAWQLGSLLHIALLTRDAGGTVAIELEDQVLFSCTSPGAKANQADWIRRKRNTVHRFQRSTYAIGRELALQNQTLQTAHNLPEADFATHGGGFPIWLKSYPDVLAGSIVVSGLPQREDHTLVVTAIAEHLRVSIPQLA